MKCPLMGIFRFMEKTFLVKLLSDKGEKSDGYDYK